MHSRRVISGFGKNGMSTNRATATNYYAVMLDRLDDIDHDTQHHDFTDRPFAGITHEPWISSHIARKLHDAARSQYQVVREDEVADAKKTDIRLLGTACPDRAVVEIKIGEKWTVRDLENALKKQLVGKYLRHASCTAGCLLVTIASGKTFNLHKRQDGDFRSVILRICKHSLINSSWLSRAN